MKSVPCVTRLFARTLEQTIVARTKLAFDSAASTPGNPLGAEVALFGSTTAFVLKTAALPWYNRIVGLSEIDLHHFEGMLEFFEKRIQSCRIEIWPGDLTDTLARKLAERNYYASHHVVTLYASPYSNEGMSKDITITEALTGADRQLAFEVMALGYDFKGHQRDMLAYELGIPSQKLFIAHIEDSAVAAAALFTNGAVAYLAGASTLPDFRSRGCQQALIMRRLQEALDCKSVTVTTAYASPSQHNLERLGFSVLHTKTVWQSYTSSKPQN
jgi:ribosomal protein S18 acetylase RimI-like enzyme